MAYLPNPIDTSRVALPADLLGLREALARNTHETWAKGRLEEGWTPGPARDDVARRHPGLVPYEDLPEAEKDYDRRTAMEVLKVILAMGYQIRPGGRPEP